MPITVQHDINPAFYGIPYLAAQEEQARRAAEERRQRQQMLQQLVGDVINSQAQQQLNQQIANVDLYPGVPRQFRGGQLPARFQQPVAPVQTPATLPAPGGVSDGIDPTRRYIADAQSRDRRVAAAYDLAGNQIAAQQSGANTANQVMGELLERQMLGGQQLAEQSLYGQQRMDQLQYDANAELRNKAFGDIPQEIVEGVNKGYLRYSPQQKTDRNRHVQALAAVRSDPTLNPQQRIQAEAIHAEAIRDIDLNPERVPPDEWPKSMQEMFDEETSVVEIGGQQVRVQRGERNGVPTWSVIEPPQDNTAKLEADRQQAAIKQQQADVKRQQDEAQFYRDTVADDIKLKAAENKNAIDFDRQFFESELKSISDLRTSELEGLRDIAPDRAAFTTETLGKDGATVEKTDEAGYKAAMGEHRRKMQEVYSKYQPMMDDLRSRYEAKRQAAQPPAQSIMPSVQPTTPGIDPLQQPPSSGGLPVAATAADVQRMYQDGTVPIGGKFIGPDGKEHTRIK